jgi:opacity protein-like surface antigen
MKTFQLIAAGAAFFVAALSTSAASVSVREIGAIAKSIGAKSTDATHERKVRADVGLSAEEGAAEPRLEVFYGVYWEGSGFDERARNSTPLGTRPAQTVEAALSFTGHKNLGARADWAARVIVGGKAVAWAAENDKALAWIKAREESP